METFKVMILLTQATASAVESQWTSLNII